VKGDIVKVKSSKERGPCCSLCSGEEAVVLKEEKDFSGEKTLTIITDNFTIFIVNVDEVDYIKRPK